MFSENSIIKDVNIINKIICYLFIVICLFMCNQPIFMLFVNLFLILITRDYQKLFIINIVNLVILILCIFFPQFLWITKFLTLVLYTILLKRVTRAVELRYVLEITLYRFQQKKITYHILYMIYFIKYYKNNIKKFLFLKDDYGIKVNYNFIVFIIKKAYQKTKIELKKFMEVNKIRFYNYSNERTYIEKTSWESWDTNYLVSHIIIILVTLFYGR